MWVFHPALSRDGKGLRRVYNLACTACYRHYRLVFTRGANNRTGTFTIAVGEVALWGTLTATQQSLLNDIKLGAHLPLCSPADECNLSDNAWSQVESDSIWDSRANKLGEAYIHSPWKAFNSDWKYTSTWHSCSGSYHWISIDFFVPVVVSRYSFRARPDKHCLPQSPPSWTLEGRNRVTDSWTIVDTVDKQVDWKYSGNERDACPGEQRVYPLSRPSAPFRYLVWRFPRVHKLGYTTISQIEVIGHVPLTSDRLAQVDRILTDVMCNAVVTRIVMQYTICMSQLTSCDSN